MSEIKQKQSRRTRKIAAIAAGLLVVGVGATYTLASWSDSEWVWGGGSGANDPGVGTSTFEVQQDTTSPYADPGTFADFESNPGKKLTFSTGALALTPGDTIYAPVALRTRADSIAGTVTLQGAVPATGVSVADAGGNLWSALRVTVYTASGTTPPSNCAAGMDLTGWGTAIISDATLSTAATVTQGLTAAAGSTQHYCFQVTLPAGSADTLQGRTVAPAWEFRSVSN